jgi:hypothetical protein
LLLFCELITGSKLLAKKCETRGRYYNLHSEFTVDSRYVDTAVLVHIYWMLSAFM